MIEAKLSSCANGGRGLEILMAVSCQKRPLCFLLKPSPECSRPFALFFPPPYYHPISSLPSYFK